MYKNLEEVPIKKLPRKLTNSQIQHILNRRFNEGAFSLVLGKGLFNKHIVFNLVLQRSLCGRRINTLSTSPFRAPIDHLCVRCGKIYSKAYRIWVNERKK